MLLILGMDALDKRMVDKFGCKFLKQVSYGNTDISDFEMARTVVLWSSFLTGKSMEKEIPVKGQWEYLLQEKDTFFSEIKSHKAIDVPAFSLKQENHKKERKLLAGFFKEENTIEDYDEIVWKNHYENRRDLFKELGKHDLLMVYFDLADAIGHLSHGDEEKMEKVYKELDSIAKEVNEKFNGKILIISDHGMEAVGRFGDHTNKGFWSINENSDHNNKCITHFHDVVLSLKD